MSSSDCQERLTTKQKEAYLHLLSRGASPASACQQLDLSLTAVAATLEGDDAFRTLQERVNELLSQNVAAALYRSAMEGSVSAQTFYLKNHPPPEWPDPADTSPAALEDLTDDQLIAQFRQAAPALLARLASGDSQTPGPIPAGPVSGSAAFAQ